MASSSDILGLFAGSEQKPGRFSGGHDDVQFTYDKEQGEEWLAGLTLRWPHAEIGAQPPHLRMTLAALLNDLAPLQPLVAITTPPPEPVPEGMIVARPVHGGDDEFESGDLDLPD